MEAKEGVRRESGERMEAGINQPDAGRINS